MLTPEDVTALRQPFPAHWHEFLNGNAYVQEWAICDRLDEIDPSWSFNVTKTERRDDQIVVYAILTVKGVTRENSGMQTIKTKSNTEFGEPEKGATTDALKRCARLFGIGRYLLRLPGSVKDEQSLASWLDRALEKQAAQVDTATGEITETATHSNGSKSEPIPQVSGQITVTHCKYVTRKDGKGAGLIYEADGIEVLDFSRDQLRQLGDEWQVVVDQWQPLDKDKAKLTKLIHPVVVSYENVFSKETGDLAYRRAITITPVEVETERKAG